MMSSQDKYLEPQKIPWQYKWKRPQLRQVTTMDIEGNSNEIVDHKLLTSMLPIECVSARLTSLEARMILNTNSEQGRIKSVLSQKQCNIEEYKVSSEEEGEQNFPVREKEKYMKWEELESDSEDEVEDETVRAKRMKQLGLNEDEDVIVTVTILASASTVKVWKDLDRHTNEKGNFFTNNEEKIETVADSVLLEVTKAYSKPQNNPFPHELSPSLTGIEEAVVDRDQTQLIMSKLLQWPTSVFVNTLDVSPTTDSIRETNDQDRKFEQINISNNSEQKEGKDHFNIWKNIRETFHLPKSILEMSQEELRRYQKQQLERKKKRIRKNIVGLSGVTLCRRPIPKTDAGIVMDPLDIDDAMDLVQRMTLG